MKKLIGFLKAVIILSIFALPGVRYGAEIVKQGEREQAGGEKVQWALIEIGPCNVYLAIGERFGQVKAFPMWCGDEVPEILQAVKDLKSDPTNNFKPINQAP